MTACLRFVCIVLACLAASAAAQQDPERRVFGKSGEASYEGKVVVIEVGENDLTNAQSFRFMRRTLRRVNEEAARAVVFNLHTPGGLATETTELMMSEMSDLKVPSFAFVNNKAMSAGALIAVATDAIYMKPVSSIGSAGLVMAGGMETQISETMQAKLDSAFGAFARSVVARKGHNVDVVRAMMFKDLEFEFGDIKVPEGELLTLTGEEAVGDFQGEPLLAEGLVDSVDELLQRENLADVPVVTAEPTGFERFAWWVSYLSPLLIVVGLAAGYLEMKTPGFGIGGIAALICFGIFFFGNNIAGNLAGYELMGIFVIGIVLILVEIFILPGLIVPGVLGVLLAGGALLFAMVDSFAFGDIGDGESLVAGVLDALAWPAVSLSIGLAGGVLLILAIMRFLPDAPLFRTAILTAASGTVRAPESLEPPPSSRVGETGVAVTDLRPAGKARVGEKVENVVTRGELIEVGSAVRVIEDGSFRMVVEKIDKPA